MHGGTALVKVGQNPVAGLQRHFGHDAAHGLDEVKVRIIELKFGVAGDEIAGQRTQLGEDLDAGKTATDNDDRQQAVALGAGRKPGGTIKVAQDSVANGNRFFNGLEANSFISNARDGECARNSAGGENDVIVELGEGFTGIGHDCRRGRCMIDAGDLAGNDARALQVRTVRDDRVTRFNRTGSNFRQERLVGHVGQRVNNGDLGLALCEPFFELPRGVKTCVAAANNQNLGHREMSPVTEQGV